MYNVFVSTSIGLTSQIFGALLKEPTLIIKKKSYTYMYMVISLCHSFQLEQTRTITMMTLCNKWYGGWPSADIYYCPYADMQRLKSLFMTNPPSLTYLMPRFCRSSVASIYFSQLSSCLQVETTPIMYKVKSIIKTLQPTTGPSFCYKIFDKLQSPIRFEPQRLYR